MPEKESVNRQELMANLARFLREALRRSKEGHALASSLGLHDPQVLEAYGVGYCDESFTRALPSKGAVRQAVLDLGLLTAEGATAHPGCLMVPVYDSMDAVAGFVAISADRTETRLPEALPLYGVNREAFGKPSVVLTDTVLTAVLLAQGGLESAAPMAAALSDEEKAFLERHRPRKAYIVGELPETLRLLQRWEVPCFRLTAALPATPAQLETALGAAEPIGVSLAPDATVRVLDSAVTFECGGRRYELRDLSPGEEDRLRVRLRAGTEAAFHVDSLDLYAGRSRGAFARAAASLFAVSEEAVEGDLRLMIRKLEAIRQSRRVRPSEPAAYVMTADEEAEALAFLRRPDLLERVAADMEALGYVGEEANKKLAYLIAVSRKLGSPLCGVIISRAAAGKSRLMEVVSELVPPEDLVSYTRITPQALYYAGSRSFKHKLVVSGEDEGLMGSDYPMRELISSKRIRLAAPVKDAATGKMKTVEYEVEGPIALFFSTTQPAIHYENATRCFILSLDESSEQTERVMRFQLERRSLEGLKRSLEGRAVRRLHRNVQRLLKPVAVVNPFAAELKLSSRRIESRREHDKYLSLIEALAFLRQHQRPVKTLLCDGREVAYVEVEKADLEEAGRLMESALKDQEAELPRPSKRLLDLICELVAGRARQLEVEPRAVQFNRRDIREFSGWSDNQVKAHIKRLEDLEYLVVRAGDRGKMYRYELGLELPKADIGPNPGTSWQPVGQKLGEAVSAALVGKTGTSWLVGPDPRKGYRALNKGARVHEQ